MVTYWFPKHSLTSFKDTRLSNEVPQYSVLFFTLSLSLFLSSSPFLWYSNPSTHPHHRWPKMKRVKNLHIHFRKWNFTHWNLIFDAELVLLSNLNFCYNKCESVEIVSYRSGSLSIGPPRKLVKNLLFFSRKHFFFEVKQANLPRALIRAFISC